MVFKRSILFLFALGMSFSAQAAEKWSAPIPKVAEKPEDWQKLVREMREKGFSYGALAASQNMLNFFSDLPSKELAYGTIIELIDLGYPFSTRAAFVPGDLDPSGHDNFVQSYLMYKGIVNIDKKMEKWADYYFNKVDQGNFPKFLFYRALKSYSRKELVDAIGWLKKTLEKSTAPEHQVLAKKASRTLARIYYEMGEYNRALEIQQQFLLKLNPIEPADWLETAWTLYQLKNFPESLGMLYNLSSKAPGDFLQIEKYVLRALIYREYCSTESTAALIQSFEKDFGAVIDGIKLGQPLNSFAVLPQISLPETQEFTQAVKTQAELARENARVDELSTEVRELAKYVYASESQVNETRRRLREDAAREALARHLVILGESLRFLKFDVAREKFNPERVFMEVAPPTTPLVDSTDDKTFRLHWWQWGDYWRDERSLYRGIMEDKCKP